MPWNSWQPDTRCPPSPSMWVMKASVPSSPCSGGNTETRRANSWSTIPNDISRWRGRVDVALGDLRSHLEELRSLLELEQLRGIRRQNSLARLRVLGPV